MKKLLLIILTLSSISAYGQDELSDYFYPWREFNYSVNPDGDIKNIIATYKMSKHNTLSEKVVVCQGLYETPLFDFKFNVSVIDSLQAVASTRQLFVDYQNHEKGRTDDCFYLFVLPEDNKTRDWKELSGEEERTCSSQYVYIKFTYDNEPLYRKAVKITKKRKIDGDECTHYSYWVKGVSRIATYQIINSRPPTIYEMAVELHKNPIIEEISKEVYEANK